MELIRLAAPLEVDLMVTSRCQLDCIFCEPWVSRTSVAGAPELDTSRMLQLITDICSNGVPYVFLTGGEPFARKDLPVLVSHLQQTGARWLVSSNGLFSDEALRDAYDAGLRDLQISIQGAGPEHSIMTRSCATGVVPVDAARRAAELGVNVSVATIPTIFNVGALTELAHAAGRAGVRIFRLLRLMPFRPYMLRWTVNPEELAGCIPALQEVCRMYDMVFEVSRTPTGDKHCTDSSYSHPYETICPAGKTKLAILPDGEAVPCHSFYEDRFRLGNVLEKGLAEVWKHPLLEEFRGASGDALLGRCGECVNRDSCYSCRSIAYRCYGSLRESDASCWVNRADWDALCNPGKCALCDLECDASFRQDYVFGRESYL